MAFARPDRDSSQLRGLILSFSLLDGFTISLYMPRSTFAFDVIEPTYPPPFATYALKSSVFRTASINALNQSIVYATGLFVVFEKMYPVLKSLIGFVNSPKRGDTLVTSVEEMRVAVPMKEMKAFDL